MDLLAVNFDKKCRICATDIFDEATAISIFNDSYLEDKIRKYLCINISSTDKLPKSICGSCFIKLEGIHRFACLALKTEENYLTFLSRMKFLEERKQDSLQSTNDLATITVDINPTKSLKSLDHQSTIRKTTIRPHRTSRLNNPRYVDHITLEQIINDKIVKNFRSQNCEIIPNKSPPSITILPLYDELKLGQFIKDPELLKLILKALKWEENCEEIENLKNTSFQKLLTNTNLLKDDDLIQLIKTYIGQDTLSTIKHCMKLNGVEITKSFPERNLEKCDMNLSTSSEESITHLEIKVDPELFLPYDDDDSVRKNEKEIKKENDPAEIFNNSEPVQIVTVDNFNFICTMCTSKFVSNVQLQEHVVTHFMNSKSSISFSKHKLKTNKLKTRIMEKRLEEKKFLKLLKNKFECIICKKRLSTKGNLKVHMETHKPKRMFACDKCGKVFKSPKYLIRHKENHL